MPASFEHITIAIRANHGSGVNGDAAAYLRPRVKNHIRMKPDTGAEHAFWTNVVPPQKDAPRAHPNASVNDTVRPDMGSAVNFGSGIDLGTRMNSGTRRFGTEEEWQEV